MRESERGRMRGRVSERERECVIERVIESDRVRVSYSDRNTVDDVSIQVCKGIQMNNFIGLLSLDLVTVF